MYYRYIRLVILMLCAYRGAKEAASRAIMRERAFFEGGKAGKRPAEVPGTGSGFGSGRGSLAQPQNPARAA